MLCEAIFIVVVRRPFWNECCVGQQCVVTELILTVTVLKKIRISLKLFDRLMMHFESSFI